MVLCLCFTADVSFFVSPRAPSADRCETLPHYWKVLVFDKLGPKILGPFPPKKKLGVKNVQNLGRFRTTSNLDYKYLWNGWKYPKSERHVIDSDSSCVRRKKSGELWSTNNTVPCGLWTTQIDFFGRLYFGPYGKTALSTTVPPTFSEKHLVNFGPLSTELTRLMFTHPNSTSLKSHISAYRGCCPSPPPLASP